MKDSLTEVFSQRTSQGVAVGSMVVLFLALTLIPNANLLGQTFSSSVPFLQKVSFAVALFGTLAANSTTSGFFLTLVSIFLSGVVIAVAVYAFRKRTQSLKGLGISGVGVVSAFAGIGCASCGSLFLSALIPVLGLGAFATMLPLGGEEFGILGIILLLLSLHLLLKEIRKPLVCT